MLPPSSLVPPLLEGHPCWSTCGRNACPHLPILSEGAGIVSTARIEGPLLYRGASASTETSQLPRLPPSQGARSESTGPTWVSFLFFIVQVLEHRKLSNLPSHAPPTLSPPLTGGWPVWAPTARVQRGPSQAARCASKGVQQATLPSHSSFDSPPPSWL